MNYRNMETDTLTRIFSEVSRELSNRKSKTKANQVQLQISKVISELRRISDDLEPNPRKADDIGPILTCIEDLTIFMENYWVGR